MQAARIAIALDLAIGIDRAQLLGVHRVELELTTHAIAQLLNYDQEATHKSEPYEPRREQHDLLGHGEREGHRKDHWHHNANYDRSSYQAWIQAREALVALLNVLLEQIVIGKCRDNLTHAIAPRWHDRTFPVVDIALFDLTREHAIHVRKTWAKCKPDPHENHKEQ